MKKVQASSPDSKDFFFCDAHLDTLSKMLERGWNDLGEIPKSSHVTIERLRKSGVGLAVFALFTEKHTASLTASERTLRMIDTAYSVADKHSDWLALARSSGEAKRARMNGKIAIVLALENGLAIGRDLGLLRNYHRLGVRMMSLTWNHRNSLGDGVGKPRARRGLTPFGLETLKEMERLGMILDVSHLNERTFWQVLENTQGPLVATHSNAFSICEHPRNLSDAQIRAISERGGFIGLNFCSLFLNLDYSGSASVDDVVRHASHIVDVGGTDVLAVGSDFDGISDPPKGLEHIGKMRKLVSALKRAGFSDGEINALAHLNFMRVFRKVCG